MFDIIDASISYWNLLGPVFDGGCKLVSNFSKTSTTTPSATTPFVTGGGSTRGTRRSNVVKEVEKLKKNREERRQRQAEEKAEKEAFLNQAPGNPYWEFLNMVQ